VLALRHFDYSNMKQVLPYFESIWQLSLKVILCAERVSSLTLLYCCSGVKVMQSILRYRTTIVYHIAAACMSCCKDNLVPEHSTKF